MNAKTHREYVRQSFNATIREFLDRDLEELPKEEFEKGLTFHISKQGLRDIDIFGSSGVKQFLDILDYKIVRYGYGRVQGDFSMCIITLYFNDYREE